MKDNPSPCLVVDDDDSLRAAIVKALTRIFSVADTFDAMTTARPYRPALGIDEAFAEFERCKGTQFDPDVVGGFLSAAKSHEFPISTPGLIRHLLPEVLSPQSIPKPPS
jgi:hypothetical protein